MIINVYHCSTVCIEEFYIPYGGLHLGGMNSALEAGLRKIRGSASSESVLYMHEVQLNISNPHESEDCGSNDLWQGIIDWLQKSTDYDCIKYNNKYEPDLVPSWTVFNTSSIHCIVDSYPIHMDDAEDILNEFLDTEI